MLLSQSNVGAAQRGARYENAGNRASVTLASGGGALLFGKVALGLVVLAACAGSLRGSALNLPNASFETPEAPRVSPYAFPDMDSWAKSPQPFWYDPSQNYDTPWDYLMGTFYNVPYPGAFIDNCDGSQAAFLFALPDIALFQDYNSISGTNTTPSHAFNAKYDINHAYSLTVGVIGGVNGAPPLYIGATLQLSFYYRDAASNMITVAATTITNSIQLFSTNTHFVDFSVEVPGVLPTDPWAGQNIGVQIASTVGFNLANGYWDLDNVRLTETALPALTSPRMTNGEFGFSLQSQPGLRFEMLASTNLALPMSNWTSLGILTNATGTAALSDPAINFNGRFYQVRQLQ
jgi:hypothetical protein